MTDVFLADPQPLLCESLSAALQHDGHIRITAWSSDEKETLDLLYRDPVDVLITGSHLRDGSGLSLIRRSKDRVPAILLTESDDAQLVSDAIAAGAAGCIGRDAGLRALATAVDAVTSGLFAIDRERLRATFGYVTASEEGRGDHVDARLARLTAREAEILQLLSQALDNETIGERLYLTGNTIRTHIGNILKKLEVHSRVEAVHLLLSASSTDESPDIFRIRGPDLG
ncbi:MAG TPA: response regulator transcription factor [Actinomycetota bacterium]|nr:response regulator transcription factor [Actinomycetota bacterium]